MVGLLGVLAPRKPPLLKANTASFRERSKPNPTTPPLATGPTVPRVVTAAEVVRPVGL